MIAIPLGLDYCSDKQHTTETIRTAYPDATVADQGGFLIFNTAAILAMLRHYREDRDFMYGLDIKFLDEARAARG